MASAMAIGRKVGRGMILGTMAALMSGGALAADLTGPYSSPYCPYHESSQILKLSQDQISEKVNDYFGVAVAEMSSKSTVVSTSAAYVWASAARYSCGEAIGYLKSGYLDDESVQKCDCFYRRMTTYR